jgi:uncharacterized membrane protein YoaK (UPF0700 family)
VGVGEELGVRARDERIRDGLLVLLTVTSGAVDAVCFLGLGHVFTAVVTGNLVLLGVGLGAGEWAAVARSVVAVGGYLAGVLGSARLLPRAGAGEPWPARVTYAIAAEVVLQMGVAVVWAVRGGRPDGALVYAMIAMYGLSMGAQSAVAQAVAVPGVTTTYVTGTVTGLVTDLMRGRAGGRRRRGLVIAAVPLGALATALLLRVARPAAPFLPAALTLAVAAIAATAFGWHRVRRPRS